MSHHPHQWTREEVSKIYYQPFLNLIFEAQKVHRENFPSNQVQLSTLLSIKTGTCPEDCGYCTQSGHYKTGLKKESLLSLEQVLEKAKIAKQNGGTRFCMGAAWKSPPKKDFPQVVEMIKEIKKMGLETCVTLGALDNEQVEQLKEAGLDYYNHNLDTSPEYYKEIISTRTFEDRLNTIDKVRRSGIKVCCGGILGMGEEPKDRIGLLQELANLEPYPESVPINKLVPAAGTPLEDAAPIDDIDFVRAIATARILMPKSYVRLSAGREHMSEVMQAMCFLAGANSIFYGEKLLVAPNPCPDTDKTFFDKLGLEALIPPTLRPKAAAPVQSGSEVKTAEPRPKL